MAVCIAETRNHATKLFVSVNRPLIRLDARNSTSVNRQSDVVGPTAGQQGFAGK
jgi:hypothetical protein